MKKFHALGLGGLLFLWLSLAAFASYSTKDARQDFVLKVEVKDENCASDGELKFEVSPLHPSATIEFSVYLLPEVNHPIRVVTDNILSGLDAGDYRVVATQTVDGNHSTQTTEVTIASNYQPIVFELLAEDECDANDGKITVNMLSGTAVTYELQGAVNRGPQAGNVFNSLPSGSYNVQVTNGCGERLTQSFEILKSALIIDESKTDILPLFPKCGEITIGQYVKTSGSALQYPMNMDLTIYLPSGEQQFVQTAIEDGPSHEGFIYADVPFFHDTNYTYDVVISDNCGNIANSINRTINQKLSISPDNLWGAGPCGERRLAISPLNYTAPYTINFLSFPEGFDPSENETYPGPFDEERIFFGNADNPIPDGVYQFEIIDACGNSSGELSINHKVFVSRPPEDVMAACEVNKGSVQLLNYDYSLEKVEILKAPTSYAPQLPQDVSYNIRQNDRRRFSMNNLPAGTYEFYTENDCGSNHTFEVEIEGHSILRNEVLVKETCGSFNLEIDHESNLSGIQPEKFGLQKLNPSTGSWEHPVTGETYIEGEDLNESNSITLFNGTTNYNFSISGTFRVIKSLEVWRDGSEVLPGENPMEFCLFTLKEFEIDTSVGFNNINVFACSDEAFDVAIAAKGYEPYTYKITSKDGQPLIIDNGNDPLFKGLEKGLYAFQIGDRCGNILNKVFRVAGGVSPRIVPNNLCDGETGELAVLGLDFLQFEWWNEEDPSNILSTGSTLLFDPFDLKTHPGRYLVRLTHNDTNSCLNEILEFEIPADDDGPQAGIGLTATVCEGDIVDLFDFVEGPVDNYGVWTEITASNSLIGNFWTTTDLPSGTYEFVYSVQGLCNDSDRSRVVLNLFNNPASPTGDPNQLFCEADGPVVAHLVAEGENIQWFLQEEGGEPLDPAEPLKTNTAYYAEQSVNGCPSTGRFETLATIEYEIRNNQITDDQFLNRFETPALITGSVPTGGVGVFEFQWQHSDDRVNWEDISGATLPDYQPPALLETIFYRRVVKGSCMDYVSNVVVVEVKTVDLTTSITSFNKEIHDGEEFIYEILVENHGAYDATEVIITDPLPAKVSYLSHELYPSSSAIQAIETNNAETISFEIPIFPKNERLIIQVKVVAKEEGPIENTVFVTSREEDSNPTDNNSTDINKILPLFIPNVIKPDFDHKNDYFIIRAGNKFQKLNLVIFNRWGDHVYESMDYQNDWSAEGLNAGTYYYVIRAMDQLNKEHVYKGYIQVIK